MKTKYNEAQREIRKQAADMLSTILNSPAMGVNVNNMRRGGVGGILGLAFRLGAMSVKQYIRMSHNAQNLSK